jgi:hypothetical protein
MLGLWVSQRTQGTIKQTYKGLMESQKGQQTIGQFGKEFS